MSTRADHESEQQFLLHHGFRPSDPRRPHSVPCCVLLCLLFLVFSSCLAISFKQGNPTQALYPLGQAYRCGLASAEQYPYAYFYNPLAHNKTVCVKTCPAYSGNRLASLECYNKFKCEYGEIVTAASTPSDELKGKKVIGYPTYKSVGNLCLPVTQLASSIFKQAMPALYTRISEQHYHSSAVDFYNNFHFILIGTAIGLLLAIIWHAVFRNLSIQPAITWTSMLLVPGLAIGVGVVFLLMSGVVGGGDFIGYLGINYMVVEARYLGVGLSVVAFGMLWAVVCVMELYRRQAGFKNVQILQSFVPKISKEQIILYCVFVFVLLAHWTLCLVAFALLRTSLVSGYEFSIYETRMFTWPVLNFDYSQVLMWYVLFWAIYGGNMILNVFKSMMILLYASKNKQKNEPLLDFVQVVCYHHMGCLAIASLLSSTLGVAIEFLLWGFRPSVNSHEGLGSKFAKVLNLFSPGCYIHMAIEGVNYFQACSKSNQLMWQSAQKQDQVVKQLIQTEKLTITSANHIVSFISVLVIQCLLWFSFPNRVNIFQPLWLLVPLWLITWQLSHLLLLGLEISGRMKHYFMEQERKYGTPMSETQQHVVDNDGGEEKEVEYVEQNSKTRRQGIVPGDQIEEVSESKEQEADLEQQRSKKTSPNRRNQRRRAKGKVTQVQQHND